MLFEDAGHKGQICDGCPRHESKRCGSSKINTEIDVLFVAEQPDAFSANIGEPFAGHNGRVVKTALKTVTAHSKYANVSYAFAYAVQCVSETEDEKAAPGKTVLMQCKPYLQNTIARFKPKVIVAMGASVLRQMGVKQTYSEARNKFVTHLGYAAPIYVTFSDKALMAAPGLFETFKLNIVNIFDKVLTAATSRLTLEELATNYLLPRTIDDAIAVCDAILAYGSEKTPPEKWPISVDTETTTLYPEKDSAKIIAFCFGWDVGRAATILYDHPGAGEEYLARLPELEVKIREVLASSKPKVFHNAKFDLKFIECKYGMPVNAVAWDTLLGEHLLDEDKKGNYGLKVLTANFIPKYCGYEDKLHDLLNDVEHASKVDGAEKELEDIREIIATEHPGFLKALEEYRDALVIYEQDKKVNDKEMAQYALALDDYLYCKSTLRGKQAVWAIDVEDWPKGKRGKPKKPVKWFTKPTKPATLKEPKKPEDPRSKKEQQINQDAGFENLPVEELQVYGAVDGDVTRQLARIQRVRIAQEKSKVAPLMASHGVPASRVLGKMEFGGTRVNIPYIDELEQSLTLVIESTEKELYEMTAKSEPHGNSINLNGAATLANVLYNWGWTHPNGKKMDAYEILARTKTGQASTSEKVLRQFVSYVDDKKQEPTETAYFIERLIKYRKASKARNTFLANIRALSKRDGFVHTQFHLNGTGTGRLSCVSADTVIDTDQGCFRIADPALRELKNPRVLTHTGRYCNILKVFPKGEDAMYCVVDSDGNRIECTKKHRFRTPTGWHTLGELHPDDQLITYNYYTKEFVITTLRYTERIGPRTVWDLSVEEDESYVAHGFVNHNSSDMNMQNLPKFLAGCNLKKLFIPDDDSMVFVNSDYKGAEVRVFCAYARDPALIQALNDGMDMHCFFAAKVFKRPYEMYARRDDATFIPDAALRKILDLERSNIKRVVFGILYGAGPDKIAETIGITPEEAKVLIELLYEMFPEIALYATRVENEVVKNHFVETFFGRRRRFPLAGLSRHAGRAKRQGRNFKIQSTSSDIVIGQLIEMDSPLARDMCGRMLLTVHDSLAYQVPKKYIGQLPDFVAHYARDRVGQKYPWMCVPFEVDTEIGDSYGECQSIDKYLAKHPLLLQPEGIVEEHELLTELRNDAFDTA